MAKAQTTASNKYNAKAYDRFELPLPKGMKEKIDEVSVMLGYKSRRSFILDLINIYGVSYETIFGENHADTWVFEAPEIESSLSGALSLLEQLVENSGSAVLEKGVDEYLKLCIYTIFRQLYEANPHNTAKMFACDSKAANEAVSRMTENLPQTVKSLIDGCHIRRDRFELPVERGHELRTFIKECEELLGEA